MKKIFCILLLAASIYNPASAQELKSELLFDLEAELFSPQAVGPVPTGTRVIFPAKSGSIKGPKLNGKILQGGGDWGLVVDSTTFKLDVRVTVETDDGALIYITYGGYVHADAKRFATILQGQWDGLNPADYYFRTNPVFETGSPKYAWLNHTVAVGVGRFLPGGKVAYRVFAIK